jgi:RHS repeat-associated protein
VDVTSANDSVNGDWTFTYDGFNRLATSNKNSGQLSYTYAYDRYGNMWQGDGGLSVSFSGANNRVDGYSYDASGNLLNDGAHSYTYDAENRITEVDGGSTAYVYDAFGHRVRRGTLDYIYDAAGHAVALVYGCQTCWYQGEVFAGSRHLATYANSTTYFAHSDWLGTERVRTDVNGSAVETCQGLPYGDGLSCSSDDITPLHFTGKERDSESNLDNFGARYYTSTMGRWMTPDWSARGEAVPYAALTNPQSLNLYAYVLDNPETSLDPDGHAAWPGEIASFFREMACSMTKSCSGQTPPTTDQTNDPQAQQQNTPAPTNPDGTPAKPPVAPPGCPKCGWKWSPDPQNPRGGRWDPDGWKGPNPPSGSWDPEQGHWDVDNGHGDRTRYLPDGTRVDHDNKPIPTISLWDRVRAIPPKPIAAWGTAAIITYIIVSEGSRVYLPRNLVPVP